MAIDQFATRPQRSDGSPFWGELHLGRMPPAGRIEFLSDVRGLTSSRNVLQLLPAQRLFLKETSPRGPPIGSSKATLAPPPDAHSHSSIHAQIRVPTRVPDEVSRTRSWRWRVRQRPWRRASLHLTPNGSTKDPGGRDTQMTVLPRASRGSVQVGGEIRPLLAGPLLLLKDALLIQYGNPC